MNEGTNYDKLLDKVALIVKQASLILKKPIQDISEVSNPSTNLDAEVSEFLSKSLSDALDVDVISEEELLSHTGVKSTCWIIDPIDGTINFISGSPDVAISVALVDENCRPIISVVFLPFFNQLYTAQKNKGARLNDQVTLRSKSDRRIVSYGLPGDAKKRYESISDDIREVVKNGFVLRQSGSAAVDICRVANGTWQGFFEKGLYVWDVAAADLIAREAGCISQIDIVNDQYECNYLVSSSSLLHEKLISNLKW